MAAQPRGGGHGARPDPRAGGLLPEHAATVEARPPPRGLGRRPARAHPSRQGRQGPPRAHGQALRADGRAALAAAEKEIEEAWDHPLASEDLSGVLPRGQRDRPRANWTVDQGKFMEAVTVEDGPENVLELALVDVNNREVAMAFSPLAFSYISARLTLWSRKRAAAALLDVTLDDKPPPLLKLAERTTKHQRALDVASRWVAHTDAPDPAFVKKYAETLADIARDVVAKQQKKKKRRR